MVELVETQLVVLGDVVERIARADPGELAVDTFSYVDLGSVDQKRKIIDGEKLVATSEAPSRARQVLKSNDVLVSTVRPNLNGVARVPGRLDGSIASTGFCVLRPRAGQLDPKYLFHWVRSPVFIDRMVRRASGASYPAVSDKIVLGSYIPVPPLGEQRRIAAVLDKADELRTKRRQALAHLNALTRAIFHSMFGDVSLNDRGWEEGRKLADVAEFSSGITKGRKTSGKELTSVPYMAVSNVQDMGLNLKTVKYIEATSEEVDRLRLVRDDLLLTEGGDPDKLGRGTLWADELPLSIHQNHVFRVRVTAKQEIHPLFLNWLVSSSRGKSYFLKSAKQTTGIASINMTQLKAFPLVIPPFRIQEEFAERVTAVDQIKQRYNAQLAELDALFAALQHSAFKGEL